MEASTIATIFSFLVVCALLICGRPAHDNLDIFNQETIYTSEDTLLARLIESECYRHDTEDHLRVGSVILNRISDIRFPNNLVDVIFDRGQFDGVKKSSFHEEPSLITLESARIVNQYGSILPVEVVGYFNPTIATDTSWVNRNLDNVYVKGLYHWYHTIENNN